MIYHTIGETEKAHNYLQASIELSNKINDFFKRGTLLNNLGALFLEKGMTRSALLKMKLGLKINQQVGNINGEAASLQSLSLYFFETGDYKKGAEYNKECFEILHKIGNNGKEMAINLGTKGLAAFEKEDWDNAILFLLQSYKIFHKIESPLEDEIADLLNIILMKIGEEKVKKIIKKINL